MKKNISTLFVLIFFASNQFCQSKNESYLLQKPYISSEKDSIERNIFQITFGTYCRTYLPLVELGFMSLDVSKKTIGGLIITPYNKELGKYGILTIAFGLQYQFLERNNFGASTIISIGDFLVYRVPPLATFNITPGIMFHQKIFNNALIISSIEYEKNFDNNTLTDFKINIGLKFLNGGVK